MNKRISSEETKALPPAKKSRGTTDEETERTGPSDVPSSDDTHCKLSVSTVLYNKLEHVIRCPVCLSVVCPPIKLCVDGHSFCQRCFSLLKECPICKHALGTGRNYAMESMLDELKLPCRNAFFGCEKILGKLQREEHEKLCEHKPFKCIDCKVEHKLVDFDKHCTECFCSPPICPTNHVTISTDANGKLTRVYREELRYMYHNCNVGFYGMCKIEGVGTFLRRMLKREEVWNFWVCVAKCEKETKDLKCKIKLSYLNNTFSFTYKGPILSVVVPEEEIIESGKSFSIPDIIIKKLMDSNDKFSFFLEMVLFPE